MQVARIAVSAAVYSIDKPYDYKIPEKLEERAVPGMRVRVPFGKGNTKCVGVILSLSEGSSYSRLKAIDALLDGTPVLNTANIRLALWMADRFFCTVFEALRVMLPAGMWFKDGERRQGDKTVDIIALDISNEEAAELADQKLLRAPKQSAVLRLLIENGGMTRDDVRSMTGTSAETLKSLEKAGIITIESRETLRRPAVRVNPDPKPFTPSAEQNAVYEGLVPLLESDKPEAALLHGVTGSGKTAVYVRLIEKTLKLGRTAILLVPEIALTPQIVSIFASFFGDAVAVLHSALSSGERVDEWKRIRSGEVKVVIGTRSAIFAPVENLGLIVIDEEHEHTYKADNLPPLYHARDVAKYRAAHSGALLLLSSATPSVESMYNAKTGKYKLFLMRKRYNDNALPSVIPVDMKNELLDDNGGCISSVLRGELEKNILSGEQSILFLNRRGASILVACGECGFTFGCKRCSVSMTYHSSNSRLLCHYCGYSMPLPDKCPECGGRLKFIGAGTQKAESELRALFPNIRIIRMDADTVSKHNSHDKLLSEFRDGKAQILLGTQMVTKGLDFDNVTLVGVISADSSLYMSDYRAHERTFSMITQVIGRSGRGEKPGRAVIQTYTPNHDVIVLASKQDYDGFFEREIVLRRALGSPPVRDLISLTASGTDETAVLAACSRLRDALGGYFSGLKGIKLLGPAPTTVSKINNRYRYRLLVSCENTKSVRETLAHTIREFSKGKGGRNVTVYADADVYD